MTWRTLLTLVPGLLLGGLSAPAQQPDPEDYVPDEDLLGYYEELGNDGSDYDLDEDVFETTRDGVESPPATVVPPAGDEIAEFREALEQHWNGNLPALLSYLNRLDPASGSNPEPPEQGRVGGWHPTADYDRFGNVIRSAASKRNSWRRRVERRLGQLASR